MNSDQAAKNDLGASNQLEESRTMTDKLDSANKQQAKKPNVKPDGDKNEESDATVTSTNEKNASAKQQGNLATPKAAPKPGTMKTTAKNSNLELPVTTPATTTTNSQTSTIYGQARGPKLAANSDSGIDSTGTDVSPSTVKDLSTHPQNSNNTPNNKRGAGNHQVTNGSLSESMTSADGSRTPNSDTLSKTNLYIRGLSSNTTDDDLYNMCAKYGTILSTKAIFDKTTGCCRGYGFVQYTTPQSAETAVAELNKTGTLAQMARLPTFHQSHNHHYAHQHHHQNHHHTSNHHANHYNHNDHHSHYNRTNAGGNMNSNNSLHIHDNNGNQTNNNHADPTNLYIANLPLDMSEEGLGTLLSSYGPVISTRILRDERNMTRGVGFARMETRDKCQEVIEKLNGKPCKGSKEPLLVKFADGGNRKRHHHQNNHHHPSHHIPHHQKYNHEDHRWREESQGADPNNVSTFEQHGNISHNNQMPDLSMMAPMGYHRMPQPYPSNINPAAYPGAPGSQPGGLQWIHPGQPWNVIQQQMLPPTGMGAPNQPGANPAGYSYAHLPQLTSQMQGLQIAHHPGAHMGGYLPPHHQWPVWPPPVPHQQPSIRMSGIQQGPAGPHQAETAQTNSESTRTPLVGAQDGAQDGQLRQANLVGERAKQVPAPIS